MSFDDDDDWYERQRGERLLDLARRTADVHAADAKREGRDFDRAADVERVYDYLDREDKLHRNDYRGMRDDD